MDLTIPYSLPFFLSALVSLSMVRVPMFKRNKETNQGMTGWVTDKVQKKEEDLQDRVVEGLVSHVLEQRMKCPLYSW